MDREQLTQRYVAGKALDGAGADEIAKGNDCPHQYRGLKAVTTHGRSRERGNKQERQGVRLAAPTSEPNAPKRQARRRHSSRGVPHQ